jgi:hypothetical protein
VGSPSTDAGPNVWIQGNVQGWTAKAAVRNKSSISNLVTMPLRPLPTHLDATFIHYFRLTTRTTS